MLLDAEVEVVMTFEDVVELGNVFELLVEEVLAVLLVDWLAPVLLTPIAANVTKVVALVRDDDAVEVTEDALFVAEDEMAEVVEDRLLEVDDEVGTVMETY